MKATDAPNVRMILEDWTKNRGLLNQLDENACDFALTQEENGMCRETVLVALHRRYGTLRTKREREALKAKAREKRRGA